MIAPSTGGWAGARVAVVPECPPMDAPRRKPEPSPEAVKALREAAAALDVEDLVDLCYASDPDPLRVNIYLEGLRGRAGEKAQIAACLLCFDLARRGDERRLQELQLLLPALDALIEQDAMGEAPTVRILTERSPAVATLWEEMARHAIQRDRRADVDAVITDADEVGGFVEIELFDEDEFDELSRDLQELEISLDLDDEVHEAFDDALNRLMPRLPLPMFASDSSADFERLEKVRELCLSFAGRHAYAAGLLAMTDLYVASHTRTHGLFLRRNKKRDRALEDGVAAFLRLTSPPEQPAAWFEGSDIAGAEPLAWEKMAEVLLELVRFVGVDVQDHPGRYAAALPSSSWAEGVAAAFVDDACSASIPPRLQDSGDRRRR